MGLGIGAMSRWYAAASKFSSCNAWAIKSSVMFMGKILLPTLLATNAKHLRKACRVCRLYHAEEWMSPQSSSQFLRVPSFSFIRATQKNP